MPRAFAFALPSIANVNEHKHTHAHAHTRRQVMAWMSFGAQWRACARANAYGTGGWKDCQPVCDALKNGRADQERMMREMMAMSSESADEGRQRLKDAQEMSELKNEATKDASDGKRSERARR